jgi:hypothetical protein
MEPSMADELRELFEQMVADEPPLRTTTDSATAAGRRLRARRRAGWAVAGAALAVMLVAAVPTLAATGRPVSPVGLPGSRTVRPTPFVTSAPARPTPTPTDPSSDPQVVSSRYCPSTAPRTQLSTKTSDGSILPDADKAAAAVVAAAPRIAPGKQFILRVHLYLANSAKWTDRPQVEIIFDVGDGLGYGFLGFQIYTEQGVTAAERATWELDGHVSCFQVQRRDYSDGSVAVNDPDSSAPGLEKVYYFAARGYDMNIDAHTEPWTTSTGPNDIPTPSTLPPRSSVPLTVSQIMALADVVAHAS